MTHNVRKLPQVKDNKSHVKHILLNMCQICLTIFLTHGVPNTPQVKPTEDNCEANCTQHVSNVTLGRFQIYSVGPPADRIQVPIQPEPRTRGGLEINLSKGRLDPSQLCIKQLYRCVGGLMHALIMLAALFFLVRMSVYGWCTVLYCMLCKRWHRYWCTQMPTRRWRRRQGRHVCLLASRLQKPQYSNVVVVKYLGLYFFSCK
jgi:hypothetical protein